jgi:tRNA (adenine22-N1)-methyltransferase
MQSPLNRRLSAVSVFVRQDSVVADIGTDHAYLPVYLVDSGKSKYAYASDINRGPLRRAELNIAESGLSDKIETRLTNGLEGLDSLGITDITVCGMGGELIASILESAPFTKSGNIRLVLQPMTKADTLRAWLLTHGYSIIDEALVKDDRIYQIICAEYSGKTEEYSPVELLLGRHNISSGCPLLMPFVQNMLSAMNTKRSGRATAGLSTEKEDALIAALSGLLKDSQTKPKGQKNDR